MKIFYVPIIPLEERYTKQWYNWIPQQFEREGYNVTIVNGDTKYNSISTGTFLDIYKTHIWEFEQLIKLTKFFERGKIKNDDIIFFADIEFPGNAITAKFISTLTKNKCKIFGFQHAGSYTKEDFVEPAKPFMKYLEIAWWKGFDGVFVGSGYHRKKILEQIEKFAYIKDIDDIKAKIYVSGNPWDSNDVKKMIPRQKNKENIIIFPHRFDYDKFFLILLKFLRTINLLLQPQERFLQKIFI
jgi:glycosyltransferase involved in cell wall biosynthesis